MILQKNIHVSFSYIRIIKAYDKKVRLQTKKNKKIKKQQQKICYLILWDNLFVKKP